jgi:hypothetical protein
MKIEGFKGIASYVQELTGRVVTPEAVRRWGWLKPALDRLNRRIAGEPVKIRDLVLTRLAVC